MNVIQTHVNEMYKPNIWMGNISDEVPFNQLTLPGTHNSASYKVNFNVDVSLGTLPSEVTNIAEHFADDKLEGYTRCQILSIEKQLLLGVRSFDFRVAKWGGKFWMCHTFACVRANLPLKHIRNFLDRHPTEVVYLRITPDNANKSTMKKKATRQFIKMTTDILQHRLYPKGESLNISMGELRRERKTAICNYSGRYGQHELIWNFPVHRLKEWTPYIPQKKLLIDQFIRDLRDNTGYHINDLEFTLTPNDEIIKDDLLDPFGEVSVLSITRKLRNVLFHWLETIRLDNINIVAVDFVQPNFIEYIVNENITRHG